MAASRAFLWVGEGVVLVLSSHGESRGGDHFIADLAGGLSLVFLPCLFLFLVV